MGQLIYGAITSLDGYIADADGSFDWAEPDEEVHAFVNDLQRPIGTYLYGRRMFDVMVAWETLDATADPSPVIRDYAGIWRAADKIVYSASLDTVTSTRTRIERRFDLDDVRRMKATLAHDLAVGGPTIAGKAFKAGLVDEIQLFVAPVVVGGGTHTLPDDVRLTLELVGERRFGNGMIHLHYRVDRSR